MNTLLTLAQSTYSYTTTTTSSSPDDATLAVMYAVFLLFMLAFTIIAYVVSAILIGRIFKKAGVPAWIAWVPFYNNYKLLEIGNQPGYWAIFAIIPIVNIASSVFMYIAMYHIGLKLGKSGTFVLWAIFLPIVWLVWLAFDKSIWNETPGTPNLPPAYAPTV